MTGWKLERDLAMEAFRFFWLKDSVAAANTASSMFGSPAGPVVDVVGEKEVGCLDSIALAASKPFMLGARKEYVIGCCCFCFEGGEVRMCSRISPDEAICGTHLGETK